MNPVIKAAIDKDPEQKGYGVLIRVDKIRSYRAFNVL